MTWWREWGDYIKILNLRHESGKTPPALLNRPILLPGLDLYLNAYQELSYDRPTGLSAGFIPWSSISNWCNLHGIYDIDNLATFVRYIRALEKTDHEIADKKAKRKR